MKRNPITTASKCTQFTTCLLTGDSTQAGHSPSAQLNASNLLRRPPWKAHGGLREVVREDTRSLDSPSLE